jgi:hypothetical protein
MLGLEQMFDAFAQGLVTATRIIEIRRAILRVGQLVRHIEDRLFACRRVAHINGSFSRRKHGCEGIFDDDGPAWRAHRCC